MELDILNRLNIKILKETYECLEPINAGMSARSFYGINIVSRQEVFIKFLIFPRSPIEVARFHNEIYVLETYTRHPMGVFPKIIDKGSFYNEEILYFITERIHGKSLSDWLKDDWPVSDMSQRLEVYNRVAGAVAYSCNLFSHRDLHPGNIILLDEQVHWHGTAADPKVKIIDWGHSFSPLLAQFDDAPDFMITLYERIPKELTGSFYCIPPDVFRNWNDMVYNPGKHDAWSMGLLLYRILIGKDVFDFHGIGDYIQAIYDGQLNAKIHHAKNDIEAIEFNTSNILAELFSKLTQLSPALRSYSAVAGRVLWDIRIEGLVLSNAIDLNAYMKDPFHYKPEKGWLYSDWSDYD